ncbi:hypothetical protein B0T10DRAFT_171646 [Thelonectria olida]|uniref:Uncharacterized protein n=1 Tax=Thelonectria olida TaxID=1576542 RepID=A0A9P8WCB5_9HYPO|nr:hypothetical protein B0T10DRAFT_171646 [Thelonectria olida]
MYVYQTHVCTLQQASSKPWGPFFLFRLLLGSCDANTISQKKLSIYVSITHHPSLLFEPTTCLQPSLVEEAMHPLPRDQPTSSAFPVTTTYRRGLSWLGVTELNRRPHLLTAFPKHATLFRLAVWHLKIGSSRDPWPAS